MLGALSKTDLPRAYNRKIHQDEAGLFEPIHLSPAVGELGEIDQFIGKVYKWLA
jgi:hypothetical protein